MFDPDVAFPLDAVEMRVLGALMEKSVTTPEYYPLTLNSLASACNQKTSREPVTDYDEEQLSAALDSLRAKGLARRVDMAGSRAPKFRHLIDEALQLVGAEFAVLTLLLLRGPQTPGQLRARSDRLFAFRDIDAVQEALDKLAKWELEPGRIVQPLPLRPGSKEVRYLHTLGPWEENAAVPEAFAGSGEARPIGPTLAMRVSELEATMQDLQARLEQLQQTFANLEAELRG